MKKKVISMMLAMTMVMALAACGQENGPQKESGSTAEKGDATESTKQEETEESEEPVEIDWWTPHEETVKLKLPAILANDLTFPEGDDYSNNIWIRDYKEKFNIEVETVFTVEKDGYSTKINLAMAENDLPDAFSVTYSQFLDLLAADKVYDLTEVFDAYASDRLKSIVEGSPATVDGRMYGISSNPLGGLVDNLSCIWIRHDWREELGLEAPETMDDLVDMIKAFKETYGSKGLGVHYSFGQLNTLAPAWGALPGCWYEDESGEIVYGSVQPEMKTALAEWAKWYQEGIIEQDFTTTNTAKLNEYMINGQMGIIPYASWWGMLPGPDVVSNLGTEAYFEPFPIPSAIGEEVIFPVSYNIGEILVVNKECEHPEAVIQLANYYQYITKDAADVLSPEESAAYIQNGMHHAPSIRPMSSTDNRDNFLAVNVAWEKQDPSSLSPTQLQWYDTFNAWLEKKDTSALGRYLQCCGKTTSSYGIANTVVEEGNYVANKVIYSTETLNEMGGQLGAILTEGFLKIIIGEEPIDYFDTVVEQWKKAGGEDATAEVNEMYGD